MKKPHCILLIFGLFFSSFSLRSQEISIEESDFYEVSSIQEIELSFSEDNWQYLLDTLRKNGNRFLIGNLEINGSKYQNVGVQIVDDRAFQPGEKRNDLLIKLNLINRVQNHQGYQTIHLSSARRDPSMIREVLGFEIARNYFPAPKANYANVNINDQYYGLLVNVENVDKKFLKDNFGDNEGSFFKVEPNLYPDPPAVCNNQVYGSLYHEKDVRCYLDNFKMRSEFGWDELMKLTDILNNKSEEINKILNIDLTLWMLAFNNVVVNMSSYSGKISENYFLYQGIDGRFNPVIWDLNLAFGSLKNTGKGSDMDLAGMHKMNPLLHAKNPSKPLINKLLSDEGRKKAYLSHIRSITRDWFVSEKYLERAEELQRMIQVPVSNDQNKYYNWDQFKGNIKQTVGKKSKIPGIQELMYERGRYLKKEQSVAVFPPKFISQEVLKRERLSGKSMKSFKFQVEVSKYTKRVDVFYKYEGESSFKQLALVDNGKSNDKKAGDNIFGGEIKPKGNNLIIHYYIRAENASLMSYEPSNYLLNTYKTSLEELN